MTDTENPRLVKSTMSFDNGGIHNSLIIGDNLPAMQCLLKDYRGAVDVTYFDPPYACDGTGRHADTNYKNKISRSDLLSMLRSRLTVVKELMTENGLIFCSIDDNNQAYVKCLMDEIFGEENFIACCPRKTVSFVTTKSKHELQKLNDYLLIYASDSKADLTQQITGKKKYPYEDEHGRYRLVPLQDNGPHGMKSARPNLYYPIYQTTDGRLVLNKESDEDKLFLPAQHKGEEGCWMWGKPKFEKDNRDLTIYDKGVVCIKHYYQDGEDLNKYSAKKTWLDQFPNKDGSNELNEIFSDSGKPFEYPKPVDLVKWCIDLCPKQDALVLDFFAGSGTTGHAVLDLNREDGGTRKFILINNNEITTKNPHGIAVDATYERLYRVMNGVGTNGETFKWTEKNEPYGQSLDVYTVVSSDDAEN